MEGYEALAIVVERRFEKRYLQETYHDDGGRGLLTVTGLMLRPRQGAPPDCTCRERSYANPCGGGIARMIGYEGRLSKVLRE